jgi:hypothetical protein
MSIGDKAFNTSDGISGALAECFVTIDGDRYNFFVMTEFKSKFKFNSKKVGILGRTGKANRPTGWEGTWTAKMHYCSPIFRKVLYEYKKTGKMPSFEIQITNEDGASTVGRQTVVHKGCYIDDAVLAQFDANADDTLSEDVSGTFDDFEIPEEFKLLDGMK